MIGPRRMHVFPSVSADAHLTDSQIWEADKEAFEQQKAQVRGPSENPGGGLGDVPELTCSWQGNHTRARCGQWGWRSGPGLSGRLPVPAHGGSLGSQLPEASGCLKFLWSETIPGNTDHLGRWPRGATLSSRQSQGHHR